MSVKQFQKLKMDVNDFGFLFIFFWIHTINNHIFNEQEQKGEPKLGLLASGLKGN